MPKQCNAEYELIEGNQFRSMVISARQKLIMLDERFDKYEDVCMVDMDMFVVKNIKNNIFHKRELIESAIKTLFAQYVRTQKNIKNICTKMVLLGWSNLEIYK